MKFVQRAGRIRRFGGTGPEQWLEDLLDYVDGYDPGMRQRIEGASPEQIAELEAEIGALPASYRLFLEHLGVKHGGPLYTFKGRLSIRDALEVNRELSAEEKPEGCLVIGRGDGIDLEHVSLRAMPQGEHQVVATEDDFIGDPISRSLPRLVLQQAFLRYEVASYPIRQRYSLHPQQHVLTRVQRAATAAKFSPYWFSDGYNLCAWAEGCVLYAEKRGQGTGWLIVAGVDAAVTARAGDALDGALSLTFVRKEVELPD